MTSPVSIPVGHELLAADFDAYENLTGVWTDFSGSLAWTALTTNPAIGNGTIVARYIQVGKFVTYTFGIVAGSTTTFGTGDWRISLPVARHTTVRQIGAGYALDSSAGTYYPLTLRTSANLFQLVSQSSLVTSGVPFAWATSDEFYGSITYEAA